MRCLVIAEDNDEDFAAFQRIIERLVSVRIIRCRDGEDVLSYLTHPPDGSNGRPSVILLDLNMPGTDGREALARIKSDPELRSIPVVVFSTSSNEKDIAYCYGQGANGYMNKPVNYTQFEQHVRGFIEYWQKVMLLPPPPPRQRDQCLNM